MTAPDSDSTPATLATSTSAEAVTPATPTPATAFEWVGGEPVVRDLVERFYDLMDLEPAYAALRAAHGTTLADSRDKLFWFLCGWLGGPSHYTDRFGHPMLRARHLPFQIGIRERDEWVTCMHQAMNEVALDPVLIDRLTTSFAGTADWMRNR